MQQFDATNWSEEQRKLAVESLEKAEKAVMIAGVKFVAALFALNAVSMVIGALIMGVSVTPKFQGYYCCFAGVVNAILCGRLFARKNKEISNTLETEFNNISQQQ